MLIAGASGHAKEILQVLHDTGKTDNVAFYDDVNIKVKELYNFPVLHTIELAKDWFRNDPEFCIGVGNPFIRHKLAAKLKEAGGTLQTIISPYAKVCDFDVTIGTGANIMYGALISNNVRVGEGTLINAGALIHHDSIIGDYCEISPGATITGGCTIGNFTSIGSNAVVLPKISVGNRVVIGAGAVVTKSVPDELTVVGNPAKILRK